ncbi:hypothetical protein LP421_07905 [Rhizobium sp. RCAM05350]|nr:hypothetical protein LP421_07905 [Rhizobium sp. RCAM05350]
MTLPRELPKDSAVVRAAQWLADQDKPPHPVAVELQKRFGLAGACVCEAHELAGRMRLLRRAFG